MGDLQKEIDFGEINEARGGRGAFRGRARQPEATGSIDVTVEEYTTSTQTARVHRERSKALDSALTLAEHR